MRHLPPAWWIKEKGKHHILSPLPSRPSWHSSVFLRPAAKGQLPLRFSPPKQADLIPPLDIGKHETGEDLSLHKEHHPPRRGKVKNPPPPFKPHSSGPRQHFPPRYLFPSFFPAWKNPTDPPYLYPVMNPSLFFTFFPFFLSFLPSSLAQK